MVVERITEEPRAVVPGFDQPRAEAAVRELLIAVGEDPDREGLLETPARVATLPSSEAEYFTVTNGIPVPTCLT